MGKAAVLLLLAQTLFVAGASAQATAPPSNVPPITIDAAKMSAAVTGCVTQVHKIPANPVYGENSNRDFDAYYNGADGKIYNNAFLNTQQMALYLFKKCLSQQGISLG